MDRADDVSRDIAYQEVPNRCWKKWSASEQDNLIQKIAAALRSYGDERIEEAAKEGWKNCPGDCEYMSESHFDNPSGCAVYKSIIALKTKSEPGEGKEK